VKILLIVAIAVAHMAIAADHITHKPFIRGMERSGTPVASAKLLGMEWPDGDETAFAGINLRRMEFVTGP
jgi:hypothetical protein